MYGKHHSEETKQILSELHKEWHKTHTHPMLGIKRNISENTINKIKISTRNRHPNILCLENGLIFESSRQAGKILNLDYSAISKCCRKVQKKCGNYHFQYTTLNSNVNF